MQVFSVETWGWRGQMLVPVPLTFHELALGFRFHTKFNCYFIMTAYRPERPNQGGPVIRLPSRLYPSLTYRGRVVKC